jgi:hypothetical protein
MPPTKADSARPPARLADALRVRFGEAPRARGFIAAAVVAALWWTGLLSLAVFTANPVVLNRVQIVQADFVVEAVVVDRKSGAVDVIREWHSPIRHDRLSIEGLSEARPPNGAAYLIPVSKREDGFVVTRGRLSAPHVEPEVLTLPYIYPTSPAAVERLETLLDELQ